MSAPRWSRRALAGGVALAALAALGAPPGLAAAQPVAPRGAPSGTAALAPGQLPAVAGDAPLDGRQGVVFHALVQPETVYVGQQATYQVGVFLGDEVRARLRRNPEFVPPEMAGMLAYELPVSHGAVPGPTGGRFEVHVFERAVFPLMAGTHEVPPARLSYSLPLTRSFFSREESHVLRSRPLRVVALAPPDSGRPAEYQGVVAAGLDIAASLRDAGSARVGDPVLLTLRVSGRGNVNLFPRPRLALGWAQAVPTDERVTLDSTSRVVEGTKEFDWLVTPRQQGRVEVPSVRYPYFDPYTERYELAVTPPVPLSVAPGTLAALDSTAAPAAGALPLRPRYGGERSPSPARSPAFWLLAAAAPLPALLLGVRRRGPRRRLAPAAGDALLALPTSGAGAEPRRVRAAFLRAVAGRVGHAALGAGRSGALARLLRREGVSPEGAAEAEALVDALDEAAYAGDRGAHAHETGLVERARASFARVDAEARRRGGGASRSGALALLLAAGLVAGNGALGALQHVPTLGAGALFADGVRSYEARQFGAAADLFAAATRRAPRAPDAWANLGTAAWAAGDTGRAALGWQRALRLEPLAADARERLHLLPTEQLAGWAAVPAVPPALLEWLALAAWLGACAGLAWRQRHRRASPLAPSAVAAGTALALGASAILLDDRLAARDLAVLPERGALRGAPALAAAAARELPAGTVVRIRARSGAWARVDADGATGWVAASPLLPLRRD